MKILSKIQLDPLSALISTAMMLGYIITVFFIVNGNISRSEIYQLQEQNTIQFRYETKIKEYISYLDSMNYFFIEDAQDIDQDLFERLVINIIDGDQTIEDVFIAPAGYIDYVYPTSKISEYVGSDIFDELTDEEQAQYNEAIINHSYVMTYDYNSDDTIRSMRISRPVYVDRQFYGIASITLDVDVFQEVFQSYDSKEIDAELFNPSGIPLSTNQVEFEEYNTRNFTIESLRYQIVYDANNDIALHYQRVNIIYVVVLTTAAFLLIAYNVKQQRQFYMKQKELEHRSNHHIITELPNQRMLLHDVDQLMKNNETFFIALGVLHNIKYINDKYGLSLGVKLLQRIADVVNQVLRENTVFYHYGGEEYILLIQTPHPDEAKNITNRVLNIFEESIVIDKIRAKLSFTFGLVEYPKQGETIEELIHNAHLSIRGIKAYESNTLAFSSSVATSKARDVRDFEQLVQNLRLETVEVYVMPIVKTSTNVIAGFECLSHITDDLGNKLSTQDVILSLEKQGRIQELDEYIFSKMLGQLKQLEAITTEPIFMSVNASALSFNESYVSNIISMYKNANIVTGTIVIELTESYQVEDYDYLIELFEELNKAGIKTAIDDFGSGYSSLSYISRFPLYSIKLDKAYVRDYQSNTFNKTLLLTMKSIADVLDCNLIAEGVDDEATLQFLKKHDCGYYQGFLFSKPIPFSKAFSLLRSNRKLK